jgi:hypothetical protein
MANNTYAACVTCKHYLNLDKCRGNQKIANEAFYQFLVDHDMHQGCVIQFFSDSYELPWWDDHQQALWRADSRSPYGYFDQSVIVQAKQHPNLPHKINIYNQFRIFATIQHHQTDDLEDTFCWLLNHDLGHPFLISSDQHHLLQDAEAVDYSREAFDLSMGCVVCQHVIKIGSAQARRYQGFEIDHQTLYDFLAAHQHDQSPSLFVHAEYQSIPPWKTPVHIEGLEHVGECNQAWKMDTRSLQNCCYELIAPLATHEPATLQISNTKGEYAVINRQHLQDLTDFANWIYQQHGSLICIQHGS